MEQNLLTLRAQLLEINYQIKQQKRVFDRKEELWKKNLIAEEEFQEARDRYQYLTKNMQITLASHEQDSLFRQSQFEQLESSLRRMEHNLEIVKENLDNLTLRAPVTGQLTSLNAEIGESKNRGQRLGQIDVLDGFKVRVGIDEHYISRINLGQKGEFTFAEKDYHLVIEKIYPEVINGRFEVDMLFVGKEPEGIRRGQTTHIRLELGDLSDAILLTKGGFYQKTGGQWVFVVDKSGNFAIKRDIRLGRQNPDVFEVLDGLHVGEQVIISSYESYGDIEKLILKTSNENQ
jgi:HlyD family secretion protein